MDQFQFLQSVELMAGLDRDGAQRAAAATLLTLAERLGQPAAGELARALPRELREPLDAAPETAEAFDAGEFVRRIAARVGAAPDQGRRDARAVFATLKEDVAAVEVHVVPPSRKDLGAQIIAEAKSLGADLIVAGAYRHSEMIEWFMGGTTRHMLAAADLPLLLAH